MGRRELSDEQAAQQAEQFWAWWVRVGGDLRGRWEQWSESKDLLAADRAAIWSAVQAIERECAA